MSHRITSHLRGNLVAYVAIFLALGGTAVAAKKIGTKQLANNAVKTKKIANNAVTGPKIKAGAVSEDKLADGAATASAYGLILVNANDVTPSYSIDQSRSSGIASVSKPVGNEGGYACLDIAKPFSVAVVTGSDAAGAVSPSAFASVNYDPSTGVVQCPAGSDLRVTTFDKLNNNPVYSRFSIVLF